MSGKQQWGCQVDKRTAEKYKQYFRKNDIYFEPSEAYDLVHISFWVSKEELKAMDVWLRKGMFIV